jgi:hypothetical protein
MLPNEVFALACRAYYDEIELVVNEKNGQFAHCPYPKGMGETGYYLLWEHHQQQGLLQSRDVGQRCFFNGHAKKWLLECDPFPDNYFDLWDIYHEFLSGEHHPHYSRTGESAVRYGTKGELSPLFGKKRPEHAQKMSERMKGENNPLYGRTGASAVRYGTTGELSPVFRTRWWVNSSGQFLRRVESPGPEWRPGRKWREIT